MVKTAGSFQIASLMFEALGSALVVYLQPPLTREMLVVACCLLQVLRGL